MANIDASAQGGSSDFEKDFEKLTGHAPFPWQTSLYKRFVTDNFPASCNLPTGLGKTNVIAVWLLAMRKRPDLIPRRLVYVVNRRTVVDQTTAEVERLRENLPKLGWPDFKTLAISTLRGQFADNREWYADPSRPAVICGTVDMIGSRLLFSGYGVGFKANPLHAGFLGQDALLVHDEAHLEPAFQELLIAIEEEQKRCKEFARFRVLELTATTRKGNGQAEKPFELTEAEKKPPANVPEHRDGEPPIHRVWRRLKATKRLSLTVADGKAKAVAQRVAELALERRKIKDDNGTDKDAAVLVFVRMLDDVKTVCDPLTDKKNGVAKDHIQQLTGTMRGYERDQLVKSNAVFARFMPPSDRPKDVTPAEGTVYLICTSAGEVGIDISADHMVCDLSTFESMAQRLGRVNRYGLCKDTHIDVVYPATFGKLDKKTGELKADEIDKRRLKTLELIKKLHPLGKNSFGNEQYDASPKALSDLRLRTDLPCKIEEAFAPEPVIPPATDILFDAWAMTSIRAKMPGRPPVESYLHGIRDWEPPETHVAWREEVDKITLDLIERHKPQDLPRDLLDDFPLKPHELLRDRTDRVVKEIEAIVNRLSDLPEKKEVFAWVMDDDGTVEVHPLDELVERKGQQKQVINLGGRTVLLPPCAGGLSDGMLDGTSQYANDVSEEWFQDKEDKEHKVPRRARVWDDDTFPKGMRLIRTIDTRPDAEDENDDNDETSTAKWLWHWYELPATGDSDETMSALKSIPWQDHTNDVIGRATKLAAVLLKDKPDLQAALILAADLHDLGKKRELWQRSIGNNLPDNPQPDDWLAKSGKDMKPRRINEDYRHEFGSLLDVLHGGQEHRAKFEKLSDDMKDLVLHLIAAHHGRARPHFPMDETYDPDNPSTVTDQVACEVPRRFARLQRKYGRWGLAYLESLLRAADWAASAEPSSVVNGQQEDRP